jgi:hypothetical protein
MHWHQGMFNCYPSPLGLLVLDIPVLRIFVQSNPVRDFIALLFQPQGQKDAHICGFARLAGARDWTYR